MDTHYILNRNIDKKYYLENKLINSLYLSTNMQSTAGAVDFYVKSPIAKIISELQLFLALNISLSVIYIAISNKK